MASFEERVNAAMEGFCAAKMDGKGTEESVCNALCAADAAEPEIGAVRRWLAGEAVDEATLPERLREVLSERDSMRIGCEIAYRREPTQAEGDAHENPITGDGECFVAMGGWTGRRCRLCNRWTWGGPTACVECVPRSNARDAAESAPALADAAAKGEPPERVPTPEEAEVLRAVDDGEPWAMKSPEAGECAKAGWIGNGHDGPGLTSSGHAALARFEAQAVERDPTPDDGGDVIDWKARALAAEAEDEARAQEVDQLRARIVELETEVEKLRAALVRATRPHEHVGHASVALSPLCRTCEELAARRAEAMGGSDADP